MADNSSTKTRDEKKIEPFSIKSKCPENVPPPPARPKSKGRVEVNKSLTRVFGVKEERDRRQRIQIIQHGAGVRRHTRENYSLDVSFHFPLFFLTIRNATTFGELMCDCKQHRVEKYSVGEKVVSVDIIYGH